MSFKSAVRVVDLSKEYRIYSAPQQRLLEIFSGGKRFHKRFKAIQPLTMEIGAGTTVGIVGRNGSGKSTLLQMIAGTVTPTTGSVEVHGRVAALLELGSGFNPDFTGRENVYLYGSIMQMSRSEINEQLESILSFADIGSFIDQPIRAYSSGMHVRLAFSAAIHVNPDVLLIDEALAVGDPAFQLKCFEKIAGFKKNGKTIIFVSHDINAITQFCDRVFVLTHGQVAFDGKPLDAINVYKSILFSDGRLQPTHLPITRPSVDEALVLNKHEKRFGNGEAEIFSVKNCDTDGQPEQIFRSNERACITFNVRGHQTVSDPVYGIRIKDKHGLQAYVDNTLHHQLSCPALNCGATQEITFRLKLHLASGDYFITVGISEFRNGNLAVLDRRNDVIQFKVLGADGLGIANLESVVEIK